MGGAKIFNYKYLTREHLKGFDNYKYSAIDTSPLSQYVMHPFWNTVVKFIPKWIAPNLLTFAGFLCMVASVILLLVYDYHCYASGGPPGYKRMEGDEIPRWVFTACGVLLFLAYNLDGIDGKQARRIGVSGPLGEMFDHGLDSYIVFFIPFCLFSVVGRDEFSVSAFRGYLAVTSVVLNFYVSHWEKYNTGTLYLPWGYDLSMWVSSIFFLIAGTRGAEVYKFYLFGEVTFTQGLEVAIHATGLFTTLPIAIYNVYLSYKNRSGKMYSFLEMLRPLFSILVLTTIITVWAIKSPNDIVEYDPRTFLLLFGTLFSNIASRLIVAEMSDQRCDLVTWLLWPLLAGVSLSLWLPAAELVVLYTFMPLSILAHVCTICRG
ncbi:hypothetical protein MSG28_013789 [Choristoneura fumiferana]|uniref:Uncharacterized protein n=1 Tax=Choristoneura fumiferana TaxID=7141 RepID=A0ACC0K8R9_CHOFU|nr:hypothetical protein MSG28_013789 [Choristoneura fumiferana]